MILGDHARRVLAVDVGLPASYAEPARQVAVLRRGSRGAPLGTGVAAAGVTNVLPYDTSAYTADTRRDGSDAKSTFAGYRLVDPGYFATLGIVRLSGDDRAFRSGAALIDRRLQAQLWSGASPMTDRIENNFSDRLLTVAGVVGTVREWNQGDQTIGAVYVDYHQRPAALQAMHFVVRYSSTLADATRAVRDALASADPLVPVTIAPLDALRTGSLQDCRLLVRLAGAFGLMALLLSAAGIHAMVSFLVARQAREAAIRLALGARPADVRQRIFLQGVAPAVVGAALGLVLAIPLGRMTRTQLFQVRPSDPAILAAAGLAIVAAAVLSTVLPARRGARVDPAAALRLE